MSFDADAVLSFNRLINQWSD